MSETTTSTTANNKATQPGYTQANALDTVPSVTHNMLARPATDSVVDQVYKLSLCAFAESGAGGAETAFAEAAGSDGRLVIDDGWLSACATMRLAWTQPERAPSEQLHSSCIAQGT